MYPAPRSWAETSANRNRASCSSIITISQPPSQLSSSHPSQTTPATSTMPHSSDEIDSDCVRVTDVDTELSSADESEGELAENKEKERLDKKLQLHACFSLAAFVRHSMRVLYSLLLLVAYHLFKIYSVASSWTVTCWQL